MTVKELIEKLQICVMEGYGDCNIYANGSEHEYFQIKQVKKKEAQGASKIIYKSIYLED